MNVKLTRDKEPRGRLRLSGSVPGETLEYSSVSRLHPAHRQPGCRGDFVAGVGQFGQRHGVFEPLNPGLGHTYACSRRGEVSGGMKKTISAL